MAKMVGVRRFGAARALWRAVRAGQAPGAPSTGERVRALPRLVRAATSGRYPDLSRGRLAMFGLGLVYLVSPIDLVPELLLTVLGLGDDALVVMWLAGSFLHETERFLRWERTATVVDGTVVDEPHTR